MKDIIINKNEDGSNLIALVENGKLIEKYDDDESIKANEGNIYCGIVRDLLPGMQSAFVDIGEDKNAFIHIKDVIPKVSNVTGNKDENLEKYKIKDYLKVNMPVLVQVKKSEENLKGARVSTHISITGRLSVLMINVDFITVSQKIENKEERARLKKLASEILSELNEDSKYGLILRTSAEDKGKAEIEKDVADLIEIWKKIKATYDENLKNKLNEEFKKQIGDVIKNEKCDHLVLIEPDSFSKQMQQDVVDFALENNLKVDSYYAQPEVEISLQMKGMVN